MSQTNNLPAEPADGSSRPGPERFEVGDPVPMFHAATDQNPRFAFDSVAGRYVLLAFLGARSHPPSGAAWNALLAARARGLLDDERACAFAVTADPADDAPAMANVVPGLRVFRDRDQALSRRYGALLPQRQGEATPRYVPFALLLDPTMRAYAVAPIEQLGEVLNALERAPETALHAGAEPVAPLILVPRILEAELCQSLIAAYEAHGGAESGFMREVQGRTVEVVDPTHKRRKDYEIADEGLRTALRTRLQRRLVPEMRKAFQFDATRIERYIVACYTAADSGHFRAHRDNTTKGTAHRRFAVSLNLNDDFDGGDLWFPEFGTRRYRPPPGGAVVFSCSLLHEATPVTRGIRYATLPFLYDDAAAKIREENRAFIGAAT
jgi:predicted 2-oxoglutarate/Fe(II)-dependent dioxygenase YbiX